MRGLVLLGSAIAVAVGCQPAPADLIETERRALQTEVGAVVAAFWDTWREADYEAGMSYYLDSPETVFTGSGIMIRGYDAMVETFRPAFLAVSSQEMDLEETQILVLAHDVAQVTQSGVYAQTDTAGARGPEIPFSFSTTWVLREGEWKVITCHQSERRPS
jgi:uncharacterized protein (TIGR02246 family)